MDEFSKMKMYVTRCHKQERTVTDFDILRTLVLIMEKIDAIEKTQKETINQKEKPYQKGLEHFEQNKEEPQSTVTTSSEQVRLLHAQRDF